MSHKQSVSLLASLLRPEQEARPVILLGAGASFSSGVPLAGESVRRLARRYYADRVEPGGVTPEQIKTSEWQDWLMNQSWFDKEPSNLSENFPRTVFHLLRPQSYRRRLLLELVEPPGEVSAGYKALAELTLRGLTGTFLTTNFDPCLPRALHAKKPHIKHVSEVNRGPQDLNEFNLFSRAQIVWLHGKAEQYTDRNLSEETQYLEPELVQKMQPLLENSPLIVVGYRGAEASISDSLLGSSTGPEFREGIYWCTRQGESLHPRVQALAQRLGVNFTLLEIEDFDTLFCDLNNELAGVRRYTQQSDTSPTAFDDQIVAGATWADIDQGLALTTMRQYCEKLELGNLPTDKLKTFMVDRGLLKDDEGVLRPTRAAVLLFGRSTNQFFPYAIVTVTLDDKARSNLGGNLLTQFEKLEEWLTDTTVNPNLKVKGRRRHEVRKAYHDRALVELAVNLLVHRDYELKSTASVAATKGHSITFTNPAAPTARTNLGLQLSSEGVFTPVAKFTDLRNRSLCDVFFGISAMERGGTGLVDAEELSREIGGGTRFAFPPGTERFEAVVLQPEASAGSSDIAKDIRPVGTYTVNMMLFSSLPSTLQCVILDFNAKEFWASEQLKDMGPLVYEGRQKRLWTFAAPDHVERVFRGHIEGELEEIPFSNTEEDADLQRKASWLIRKHFEDYVRRFEKDGLVLERTRKGYPAKRAYFSAKKGGNRYIYYDTPKKKGIRRGVVKKRGDESKPYFECEGFGYEIVKLTSRWGVRIKPFYMFIGSDGKRPLPGYMRTKRSNSRMRFDRNAAVGSDLGFFEQFLRDKSQSIDLGGDLVSDLLLEGGFYTIDTEEIGLVTDDIAAEDKRTA